MTRAEFLGAIVRSPAVKAGAYLAAAAAVVAVGMAIWQARVALAITAAFVAALVVLNTAMYVFATRAHRRRLDRDVELARSHWSYIHRGLVWPGLGVALGGLIAYCTQGRDPTGELIGGGLVAGLGLVARVAWAHRRAV
jgi:hypothetical protein